MQRMTNIANRSTTKKLTHGGHIFSNIIRGGPVSIARVTPLLL